MATRAGAAPPSRQGAFGSSLLLGRRAARWAGSRPRQRRGAPAAGVLHLRLLSMDCGSQPSSRRAHRPIRLSSDPGVDGTRTFKACGSTTGAGVIAGAAKSQFHRRKSCAELGRRALATSRPAGQRRKQPWRQLHRAPSRAARTRCADARRRAPRRGPGARRAPSPPQPWPRSRSPCGAGPGRGRTDWASTCSRSSPRKAA